MTRNRVFIAATTVVVVFFLTFLGMRLSFLDKSPRPKSRPRAVITQVIKSASGISSYAKQNFAPVFDVSYKMADYQITTFILLNLFKKDFLNPSLSQYIRPLQGRSPPLC